jgi:membrane-bound ClpP family serine protease
MMVAGGPGPVLWSLLGADIVLGAGVGAVAWKGLSAEGGTGDIESIRRNSLEGAEGVALGDLTPEGIVRVRGELWSAVSLNGTVPDSTPVQVLRVAGVRLEVWGEHAEGRTTERLFDLEEVRLDPVERVHPVRADHGSGERGVQ